MGLSWSIHKNGGWKGQLERVERWHKRLLQTRHSPIEGFELEDFAYTFFQNCYHLREWIQKTSQCPKEELDALMNQSQNLRLCRDIANGTKHRNINTPSVVSDFSIGREYAPHEPHGYRLFLIANGKHDLLALANNCVEDWKHFISERADIFS